MAKIIIVGGGVSGLSAGIYAQMSGHSATIYEKHFKAGGNLTGWDREGYHIDNCIHWLTGTNPLTSLYKMWVDLDALGSVPVYQAQTLFTYELDGEKISIYKDTETLEREMLRISPRDEKETRAFVKAVRAVQRLNGISGKNCDKKSTFGEKILAIPALVRYYSMSTGDLADRFESPILRGFLTSFMTERFSSLALIMVFATFTGKNGGIPEGSSCKMAERMTEKFKSLGGELVLRCGVKKINEEGGHAESVTLDNGECVTADYVIVTADPASAFGTLLDEKYMPKALKKQYDDPKMLRFSSHHAAFACDLSELPFSGDVAVSIPEKYREEMGIAHFMIREFSHEPSFAPEGKSILQTMTYCFEDYAVKYIEQKRDPDAYKARKAKIAGIIEELICEKYPELSGALRLLDTWTPATYKRYVGSEMGSFMSFALPKSTPLVKHSGKIPGLDNVFLATQWQQAPGGLPIAAICGKDAIALINKNKR